MWLHNSLCDVYHDITVPGMSTDMCSVCEWLSLLVNGVVCVCVCVCLCLALYIVIVQQTGWHLE